MGPSLLFDVEAGTPTELFTADRNDDGAIDIASGNTAQSVVGVLSSEPLLRERLGAPRLTQWPSRTKSTPLRRVRQKTSSTL